MFLDQYLKNYITLLYSLAYSLLSIVYVAELWNVSYKSTIIWVYHELKNVFCAPHPSIIVAEKHMSTAGLLSPGLSWPTGNSDGSSAAQHLKSVQLCILQTTISEKAKFNTRNSFSTKWISLSHHRKTKAKTWSQAVVSKELLLPDAGLVLLEMGSRCTDPICTQLKDSRDPPWIQERAS